MVRASLLLTTLIDALHEGEPPTLLHVHPTGANLGDSVWPDPSVDWPRLTCSLESLSETVADLQSRAKPVHVVSPWGRIRENVGREFASTPFFEQAVLASLSSGVTPTQDLTILLPSGSIIPRSRADLRRQVLRSWDIRAVIVGTGGLEQVNTSFEWVLVHLGPRPGRGTHVFARVDPDRSDAETVAGITDLLKRTGGQRPSGYVTRGDLDPLEPLAYGWRDPRRLRVLSDLQHYGPTQPLTNLFEIHRGVHEVARAHLLSAEPGPGLVPILTGRDLKSQRSRSSQLGGPPRWIAATDAGLALLQPGDLLLQAIQARPTAAGAARPLVSDAEVSLPAAAGNSVVILRPHRGVDQVDLDFAVLFLRSRKAASIYTGPQLGSGLTLRAVDLAAFDLPVPSAPLRRALELLDGATRQFAQWASEARAGVVSIFDHDSAAVAAEQLITASRRVRWREEEAQRLDDEKYLVRSRFPYPVANRWRSMEALCSGQEQDRLIAYLSVLATSETLVAFVALCALAIAEDAGHRLGFTRNLKDALSRGRGPTFGDWKSILQESSGKTLGALELPAVSKQALNYLSVEGVSDALDRTLSRRNAEGHQRGPSPIRLETAIGDAQADLDVLVTGAEFLADLRLQEVVSVRWDRFAKKTSIQHRELIGDHPIVPQKTAVLPLNGLETGSLYLSMPTGEWIPLRPFILTALCPECQQRSTFYIDTRTASLTKFKSFENGHLAALDEADALAAVGLA